MTFTTYKLTPVDTLFFRDGRPYNQGESSSTDIKSLFPPFAITMVGALRASLSRGLGWNGEDDWPSEIKTKLGDGQNLGPLKFKGPYLVRDQEVLFPAPLNLLGKASEMEEGKWSQLNLLHPGEGIDCDIGDKVRLPTLKNGSGMKSLNGYYLTSSDLGVVLKGADLSKVNPIKGSALWDFEYLVGIQRNFETRTTEEGLMYSRSRVRLSSGVGLAVGIEGLEADMKLLSPLPFGGDGGLAYADPVNIPIKIPDAPGLETSNGKIRFTVTHLTPAYFEGKWPGPGEELPGISGSKVVSACLERPIKIGGWDSVKREPLALNPFLPGGSTWFCEANNDDAERIWQYNGQHIGKYCEYGFGEIAIGQWRNEE